MPFLEIRHTELKGNLKLFEYNRYKDHAHPILEGIDKDKDFLQEMEVVNVAKNYLTNESYQTDITFPSPWKKPRKFDNKYRFFGVEIYQKVEEPSILPNYKSTQTFTLTSKTLQSEAEITDIDQNHPID
jgi:hypothetical protein